MHLSGDTWPLASTEFFAEDTAQAEMSEAVTAVTAGSLTGSQAYWLLQYLRQNTTGDLACEASRDFAKVIFGCVTFSLAIGTLGCALALFARDLAEATQAQ